MWAVERKSIGIQSMIRTQDRPAKEQGRTRRKDSESVSCPTEVDRGSAAYYLIHAPPDADLREVAEAWHSGESPAEYWGTEVNGHAVLKQQFSNGTETQTWFSCSRCGEREDSESAFQDFECGE